MKYPLLIFFKNTMKWLILMTILITLCSNSWFVYWLMMEMNLLLFIPIMNNKKQNNSNSMVTYFVIQSFSSSMFFFGSLNYSFFNSSYFLIIMVIALMIKLAVIPFHFWLTSLSETMNYPSMFIILTMQKIIPLHILSLINMEMMIIFAAISAIFGSIFALNLKSFKKILIFSSISHQGWVITLIVMKSNFWIMYMVVYTLLIFKITKLLNEMKIYLIHSFFFQYWNPLKKISLITMMMSLGGMPPFLGFFIKLISIIILINLKSLMVVILIVSSIINIFFYTQIITPNLMKNTLSKKNLILMKINKSNLLLNLNSSITIFLLNLFLT